jgi:hypothetical protein
MIRGPCQGRKEKKYKKSKRKGELAIVAAQAGFGRCGRAPTHARDARLDRLAWSSLIRSFFFFFFLIFPSYINISNFKLDQTKLLNF